MELLDVVRDALACIGAAALVLLIVAGVIVACDAIERRR